MKPSPLLFVLLFAASSRAADVTRTPHLPPRLSGDDLVKQIIGEEGVPRAQQSPQTLYKQHHAEGYMAGVAEATEGRLWCAPERIKWRELDDRVFAVLWKNDPGSMPGNAAELLVQQLAAKYPCP